MMTSNQRNAELLKKHCAKSSKLVAADNIKADLVALPGWQLEGQSIAKTFTFKDYHETIAFVNATAEISHKENHHPDLAVSYDKCVVTYSTHDAGGVTENDLICAAKVEQAARK